MKKISLPLILACMSLLLCGCGTKSLKNAEEPAETPEIMHAVETPSVTAPVLPHNTSEELNLYSYFPSVGIRYVVNEYGKRDDRYSLDQDGNILDSDGALLIMEDNVKLFRPIRTIYFGQERYQLIAEGDKENQWNGLSSTQVYSNCIVDLYCAPASATSGIVCVRSESDAEVEIRPFSNAKFATVDHENLEPGEVAIIAEDLTRPVKLYIRVLPNLADEATILARSLDRSSVAECVVSVELTDARRTQTAGTGNGIGIPAATASPSPTPAVSPAPGVTEFVNASGDPAKHVHSYTKTVIPPTASEEGYTTYACTECGYSYQDDYVSKLIPDEPSEPAHTHIYIGMTIPPTDTEPGYTLYICDVCGDSYKTNITPADETESSGATDIQGE